MISRSQIKGEAKQLLHSAAVSPFLMTAIVLLIAFVLDRLLDLVEHGSIFYTYTYNAAYIDALNSGNLEALRDFVAANTSLNATSIFFSVLVSLFTIILNSGYYAYCIGVRQRLHMPYSTLLDGLSVSGRLIWCSIQMWVKTFLWSLLFIVPGWIALYRYRFAYYNILTDPTLSASEAIQLSCRQTSGMKMKLFFLDVSFLGWTLLPMILAGLLNKMGLFLVGAAVTIAIQIWVTPYMTLCDLAYFETGQRHLGRPPYGVPVS